MDAVTPDGIEMAANGNWLIIAFFTIAVIVYLIEKWQVIRKPAEDAEAAIRKRVENLEKWQAEINLRLEYGSKEFDEIKSVLEKMQSDLERKIDTNIEKIEKKSDKKYEDLEKKLDELEKTFRGAVLAGIGSAEI